MRRGLTRAKNTSTLGPRRREGSGKHTVMDDSPAEHQPQAFDARAVHPTSVSIYPVTSQVLRAPDTTGAAGDTDGNLINIQRSYGDRG